MFEVLHNNNNNKIVIAVWRVVVKISGHVFSWVEKQGFAANGKFL